MKIIFDNDKDGTMASKMNFLKSFSYQFSSPMVLTIFFHNITHSLPIA